MQGGAAVPHFASKMHLSSSVSLGHLVTEIHSGCLGCDRLCCEEMPGNKAVGIFCVCSYMVDTYMVEHRGAWRALWIWGPL